ncbi:hypothetical protein D7030_11225 [Flavobacteriaceae bacterium AU392]|nr:hypothetical protein D1817_13445 [Flavobacteriaceae bacterium]RKM82732.1 hypothetical protein D7030_11225 [Flavobacteriaceae bacterium AU392]
MLLLKLWIKKSKVYCHISKTLVTKIIELQTRVAMIKKPKTRSIIFKITGTLIMLSAFLTFPNSEPWYYEVLIFDLGLLLILISKIPKLKIKIKEKV